MEPDFPNLIPKVKLPRQQGSPIQGISKEQVLYLITKCPRDTFNGERDRTILSLLFATELRTQELCDIKLDHIDLTGCSIFNPNGKGNKPRSVFFSRTTRKQLR
jgi:site-specific recombinase XerD